MRNKIKGFIKWTYELIKSFWSIKGMISLGISFMLFYGWLLAFIVIGLITNNAWFYGVGIGGVIFWAGPFTPFIVVFLGFATFLRKVVLRDRSVNDMKIEKLVGMDIKKAEKYVESYGYHIRINKENGLVYFGTQDVREDRINVEEEKNKVVKVNGIG